VILVDTSIWLEHFRRGVAELAALLESGLVLMHPFVLGELACAALPWRDRTLEWLAGLTPIAVADDAEVLKFIAQRRLSARGVGYIDAHLLASVVLEDSRLWTRDPPLRGVAEALGLAVTATGARNLARRLG